MGIYIDFDGVIVDTETHLFDDYERQLKLGLVTDDQDFVRKLDYKTYVNACPLIEGSIDYLISHPEACVLTKVCSEKEYLAKRELLLNNGVTNKVISVPIDMHKSDIVDPHGNILVDDTVHNLDSWVLNGGEGYYFNFNGNLVDPWGNENKNYELVTNLQQLNSKIRK